MKEYLKDSSKELEVYTTELDDCIVVKFGQVEVSINKNPRVRDIAILVHETVGVIWADKYENRRGTDGYGYDALKEDGEKLETLREAMRILREE